jgi:hypothetical protein
MPIFPANIIFSPQMLQNGILNWKLVVYAKIDENSDHNIDTSFCNFWIYSAIYTDMSDYHLTLFPGQMPKEV